MLITVPHYTVQLAGPVVEDLSKRLSSVFHLAVGTANKVQELFTRENSVCIPLKDFIRLLA